MHQGVDKVDKDANNSAKDALNWVEDLVKDVPKRIKMDIPETESQYTANNAINHHNEGVMDTLEDAKIAAIRSFTINENERAKRQRPLLIAILVITAIQCVFFNVLMGGVAFFILKMEEPEVLYQLFEILKWYIGATVVEFIGIIAFIVRATFSNDHMKVLYLILQGEEKTKKQSSKKD